MKSKMSSSNISVAFMAENFKRFWLGSLFALIGYVMGCIMPILVNRHYPGTIENIIEGGFLLAIPLVLVIPLFAAVLIYRFLQTPSSSSIVHALPLTRKQIFNSSFVSGIILCIVPIILTAVMLIVFRGFNGPINQSVFDPQTGFHNKDVLSIFGILIWMVKYSILTAAVFTASMLAAMLTGSTIMQCILSMVIVLFVPGTLAVLSGTADIFVYGYVSPDFIDTVQTVASPVAAAITPEWKYVLSQLAISIILFILGWQLYKRRNIEKASDTLVFTFTKPIVKYALTFLAMCSCGILAVNLQGGESILVYFAGAILGATAVFLGIDVAINRNFNVKRFALGLAKFAAAMVVISLILMLDLTGYESRIPDADDIKGVNIEGLTSSEFENYGSVMEEERNARLIKSPEAIAAVQAMHGDVIEAKSSYFNNSIKNMFRDDSQDNYAGTIILTYYLKNGSTVRRTYEVPVEFYTENDNARAVVESWDYKKSIYPIDLCTAENVEIKSETIEPSYEGSIFGKNSIKLGQEDFARLAAAYSDDLKDADGKHMGMVGSGVNNLITINVSVEAESEIDPKINEEYYKLYGYYYSEPTRLYIFNANSGFTRTMELLKEMGIYDSLVILPEDVSYASAVKQRYVVDYEESQVIDEDICLEEIDDIEKIAWILENGDSEFISYATKDEYYYEVKLYPKTNNDEEGIYRYFTVESAPDFIKSLF